MNDDATLLRRYVSEGSQAAFTELVQRYVDLVYGAAMRRTNGDVHRASEVAQEVFTSLARNARKLSSHPVLPAWLHTATRNAALNLMISEQRRKVREAEATAMETVMSSVVGDPDWDRIKLVLDSAIDELAETDRTAIVLRFLQKRPFVEIGRAVQISEDAARMRTDRALDKLRSVLVRRGITSTTAALGSVVLGQPLISAPAGVAAVFATQAIVASGTGFLLHSPLL
jgi:RNA polymerase sigma factor (sigma-70 family)